MDSQTLTKLAAAVVAGGITLELLGRRSRPSGSETNAAFVFVKPHACNDAVVERVRKSFAGWGITIKSEAKINGAVIDAESLIDNHYGAIAAKAMTTLPADLHVPTKGQAAFEKAFGLTWAAALAAGQVYNAKQACEKLGIDGAGLDAKWAQTNRGVDCIKFGGGFYCASIDGIFIMNGFYMSMRGGYCKQSANIHTFTVEWPAAKISWERFRGEVLGGTNPAEAAEGSLRKDIFDNWAELGLAAEPNTGDNGMHASASPFEGLAERLNWCGATVASDIFGSALLAAGVAEETILAGTQDPQATLDGKTGSFFDHLEDQDAADNIANIAKMTL
jgi:nucleoside diphosphate kinase